MLKQSDKLMIQFKKIVFYFCLLDYLRENKYFLKGIIKRYGFTSNICLSEPK